LIPLGGITMSDNKKPDAENEEEELETNEGEGGDKVGQGSTDSAAPADDDIIIK
jgi:hypothetical protein